ncbi:MAG TPA: hypothetical protein VGO68_11610 [Pyrinomonadaceae bacterium]|jgi:hypothetical protein|nr:hypothetical protein [Pyrinomonadaceae bacterium]
MIKKFFWIALIGIVLSPNALAESTINCGSGYIDVVDWMTLDADLRATKHMEQPGQVGHPMYTAMWPDKFWWIKTSDGNTWDINTFDDNYIYWWVTGNGEFGHPENYTMAAHGTNYKAAPRCAPATGYPTTVIINDNSDVDTYHNCIFQNRANLLKTGFSLWGPYYLSFGGDLPANMPTYVVGYSWNCNDAFTSCDKEEYYISQRYGLVGYEYYRNVNQATGEQVLTQSTVWNTLTDGSTTPNFVCF